MDTKLTLAEYFDRRALDFGKNFRACDYGCRLSFTQRREALLQALGAVSDKRVLDVGCGPGIMTAALAKNNRLVGIDPSLNMLKLAKSDFGVVQAVGESLPFKNASFDFVVAAETLQHVGETKLFLKELVRVTRAGGFVILSALHENSWLHHAFSWKESYRHLHFHSLEAIKNELSSCGIRQIEVAGLCFPFPFNQNLKERRKN